MSHRDRGLSKHYHLRFGKKLGHDICAIFRIPCNCVSCISMLEQPCISDIFSKKKSHYQPVANCNYLPVIVSFNKCNITHLSQKLTPSEASEEMYQVVIDRVSDNMASLFQYDNYGAINIYEKTPNGCNVIKFIS